MNVTLFKMLKIALVAIAAIFFVLGSTVPGCMRQIETAQQEAERHTYSEFAWPSSEYGQMLPKPESNIGRIDYEQSYGFSIQVSNTDQDHFDAYVRACKEKGFAGDYADGGYYYHALNDAGYALTLSYDQDDDVMTIRISEPTEPEAVSSDGTSSDTTSASPEDQADTTSSEGAPVQENSDESDFRAAMDSYEAFIDEYCAFMKKYNESGNPVSMLADYTSMVARYAEMTAKMDAIDEGSLSPEEWAYYSEVMMRTNQKLAELV